ncbi:hypothetical protein K1719_024841 [Acacia pycnantha]|nr:hypothetical protein K1719_024841 [Acacia pycnantha]
MAMGKVKYLKQDRKKDKKESDYLSVGDVTWWLLHTEKDWRVEIVMEMEELHSNPTDLRLDIGIYILFTMHWAYDAVFQKRQAFMALLVVISGAFRRASIFAPFIAFQAHGHRNMCVGRSHDEVRPWCKARIPLLYNYIQSQYWDIGPHGTVLSRVTLHRGSWNLCAPGPMRKREPYPLNFSLRSNRHVISFPVDSHRRSTSLLIPSTCSIFTSSPSINFLLMHATSLIQIPLPALITVVDVSSIR